MDYLDNIISKYVIKSSLYKKEKYKLLYINFSALLISCITINLWFEQLSIQLLNKRLQYIILTISCIIDLFFAIISAKEETKDIDCAFVRKYNTGLSPLKSLIQLKGSHGSHGLKSIKNSFEFALSFFITLIVSPFFSNILAGQETAQIYVFILLVLIYIVCITSINMILLIFNLNALKYDCLLEMIYLYEIESNVRKKSISKKFNQILNYFRNNHQS